MEHCLSHNVFSEVVLHGDDWLPLAKAEVQNIARSLKIVPAQVEVAYELLRLESVNGEESERKFRLMVKRRLLRLHRDELSNATTSTKKEELHEHYCLVRERYDLVLPNISPGGSWMSIALPNLQSKRLCGRLLPIAPQVPE